MKIASAQLFGFSLPLKRPLALGGHTMNERSGWLLRLTSDDGTVGWGEASPLPGWSQESTEDVRDQLKTVRTKLVETEVSPELVRLDGQFGEWLGPWQLLPSVRCGVEMAILNLIAATVDRPLARLLNDRTLESVPLNGLITDDTNPAETARRLKREGYRAVKMKVGRGDLQTDIERTQDVYHELGDSVKLRLDANRAWDYDTAVRFAEAISDCSPEYIEEPLADPGGLREFTEETGMPVALDETLADWSPDRLADHPYLTALILKPSLIGGFERSALMAGIARERKTKVIVSSCFESSLGIASMVQLAAAYGSINTPAGLDTLGWFEHDLISEPLDSSAARFRIGQTWRAVRSIRSDLLTGVSDD